MRKTDKKIENALRQALVQVCEIAQSKHEGFEWLTHFANYDRFPNSLSIVCVFDSQSNLSHADQDGIRNLVKTTLASAEIKLKDINRHVSFDTEERCTNENNGKWKARFQKQGFQH